MNIAKVKKLILPSVFSGFIIAVSLLTFILPKREYSEAEKRYLAKFPEFNTESVLNGEFQDGFEKYVSDHILGRDFFVEINSYFSLIMGRNSVSDIYHCKDGYLINAPKNCGTDTFKKNMENFNRFTKSVDIPSSLMIVPTAGYIMEDKLPLFHGEYNDGELFELAASMTPDIGFIDTRNALLSAVNGGGQAYYRTDHHLTSEGTYAIYSLFCSINGISCPEKEWYNIKTADGFRGTTLSGSGYGLVKPDTIEMWQGKDSVRVTVDDGKETEIYYGMFFEKHLEGDDKYPVFLGGNHALTTLENPDADEGTLLMIKDSYAHCFAPFLAHNYRRIYLIDMRYYRKSVSEFARENNVDEILYLYGTDSLLTDTNSAWLQ